MGKAATCNAGVPNGHGFESWLSHFRSSSLLVCLKKQRKMMGDSDETPGSNLTIQESEQGLEDLSLLLTLLFK